MGGNQYFKNVLKNSLIVLKGNIGSNIFGLISLSIFTQVMGSELFGYYTLIIVYIGIIDRIFNFQTWQAFVKYATDFIEKKEEYNLIMLLKYCFIVDLFSLLIATLVSLILSKYLTYYFNIPHDYYPLVLLMSLTIIFKIFEISVGIFRVFDQFKLQADIEIISSIFKFLLFGLVALISPSFNLFIYATALAQLLTMIIKCYLSIKVLKKNDITFSKIQKQKIDFSLTKELKIVSFIVYNNFDVAVRMVSRQLDILILGKLYGAGIVGIYRVAKEIAGIIGRIADPIYQAIYPEFAKMLTNNKKSGRSGKSSRK